LSTFAGFKSHLGLERALAVVVTAGTFLWTALARGATGGRPCTATGRLASRVAGSEAAADSEVEAAEAVGGGSGEVAGGEEIGVAGLTSLAATIVVAFGCSRAAPARRRGWSPTMVKATARTAMAPTIPRTLAA
jgi:hypothetical protein